MSLFDLIPSAYAQTASGGGAATSADLLQQFAPIIIIVGIFYFLLIRPQQQKQKQLKAQLAEIKRGDNIVTAGGILGTVARVINDDEVSVEIAEGVRIRVVRATITAVTGRGEPRPDADAPTPKTPTRKGKTAANEGKPQA